MTEKQNILQVQSIIRDKEELSEISRNNEEEEIEKVEEVKKIVPLKESKVKKSVFRSLIESKIPFISESPSFIPAYVNSERIDKSGKKIFKSRIEISLEGFEGYYCFLFSENKKENYFFSYFAEPFRGSGNLLELEKLNFLKDNYKLSKENFILNFDDFGCEVVGDILDYRSYSFNFVIDPLTVCLYDAIKYRKEKAIDYTQDEVKFIIKECSRQLDNLHSIKVSSRAFTPKNIFLDSNKVKILSLVNDTDKFESYDLSIVKPKKPSFYLPEWENLDYFNVEPSDSYAIGILALCLMDLQEDIKFFEDFDNVVNTLENKKDSYPIIYGYLVDILKMQPSERSSFKELLNLTIDGTPKMLEFQKGIEIKSSVCSKAKSGDLDSSIFYILSGDTKNAIAKIQDYCKNGDISSIDCNQIKLIGDFLFTNQKFQQLTNFLKILSNNDDKLINLQRDYYKSLILYQEGDWVEAFKILQEKFQDLIGNFNNSKANVIEFITLKINLTGIFVGTNEMLTDYYDFQGLITEASSSTFISTNSMVANIMYRLGKFDEATKFYNEVIDVFKEFKLESHLDCLKTMLKMGMIEIKTNNLYIGFDLICTAFDNFVANFGKENSYYPEFLFNLALAHYNSKSKNRSFDLFLEALKSYGKTFDKNHPKIPLIMSYLGILFAKMHEKKLSLKYLKGAKTLKNYQVSKMKGVKKLIDEWTEFDIRNKDFLLAENKFENNMPIDKDLVKIYSDFALVLFEENEKEEARKLFKIAYTTSRIYKVLMINDFEINLLYGDVLVNFAFCMNEGNNFEKVVRYLKAAEECKKLFLKDTHPEVIQIAINLAKAEGDIGNYTLAIQNTELVLSKSKSLLGEISVETALLYNNLGTYHSALENNSAAEENFNKALQIYKMIYIEDHPNIAECYNNKGLLESRKEEYENALENFKRASKIYIDVYGDKVDSNVNYIKVLNNIGITYCRNGEFEKACTNMLECVTRLESVFKRNHPEVANAYNNLGVLEIKVGRVDEAEKCFKISQEIYEKVSFEGEKGSMKPFYNLMKLHFDKSNYDLIIESVERKLEKALREYKEDNSFCFFHFIDSSCEIVMSFVKDMTKKKELIGNLLAKAEEKLGDDSAFVDSLKKKYEND